MIGHHPSLCSLFINILVQAILQVMIIMIHQYFKQWNWNYLTCKVITITTNYWPELLSSLSFLSSTVLFLQELLPQHFSCQNRNLSDALLWSDAVQPRKLHPLREYLNSNSLQKSDLFQIGSFWLYRMSQRSMCSCYYHSDYLAMLFPQLAESCDATPPLEVLTTCRL